MHKDNIQNAEEDIFNKSLYILENSTVYINEKEFNITGELNGNISKLKNNKILIQFHFDKNKNNIKNSTCYLIDTEKSNVNKVVLKCNFSESFNYNIIDGYSNLNNGSLIIIYKNIDNNIEMDETEPIKFRFHWKSSSDISTGAIIAIIIGSVIFIAIVWTLIFFCYIIKSCGVRNSSKNSPYDYKDNILEIRFTSQFQPIAFSTFGSREDNFSRLEEMLFQKFPELRYKNIYFKLNGTLINRSATLLENRISDGDSITICEIY